MTAQAAETIIIAGNEFKLKVSLLPKYLKAYSVQMDEGKSYTAIWELKGNGFFINKFTIHANGKLINMNENDLFHDLFYNPSTELISGFTTSIEVEIYNFKSFSSYIMIQLDKCNVAHVFHRQIKTDSNATKVENLEEIPLDKLDIILNIDPFVDSNPTTVRLLEVMKEHPRYFISILCYYYPFTREMLREYQKYLYWEVLCYNNFLDWNEDLLMEFKGKWILNDIAMFIVGSEGGLSNIDLLLKYYEMGLIDAYTILANGNVELEQVNHWMSQNENLKEDLANKDYYYYYYTTEKRSNCTKRINSLMTFDNFMMEYDKLKYINFQIQPKELEEIIFFIERHGDFFDEVYYSHPEIVTTHVPDPFFFNNPFKNGIEYTFNTPEKRKILDDAVKVFFEIEAENCYSNRPFHDYVYYVNSDEYNDEYNMVFNSRFPHVYWGIR